MIAHRYDANLLGPHVLGELHVVQGQLDKAEQHIRQPLKAAKTGNALLLLGDLCFINIPVSWVQDITSYSLINEAKSLGSTAGEDGWMASPSVMSVHRDYVSLVESLSCRTNGLWRDGHARPNW